MTESKDLQDKYSIIIPYRDRESHLQLLLPRLQEVFANKDYEIIVSEQNDSDNFNLANTQYYQRNTEYLLTMISQKDQWKIYQVVIVHGIPV